jgi:CRISPR/Cas system endoribonuclease Cas6 (RAMP superfamily)
MKKFILIALTCLIISSCSKEEPMNNGTKEVTYEYRYEVSGDNYLVIYKNNNNYIEQLSSVDSVWTYSWTQELTVTNNTEEVPVDLQPNPLRWLYVSATNNNQTGNVTVKIYRNNVVVATNTGYGGNSIATISGEY